MSNIISVAPKSSKAKNRFANLMQRNAVCIVEQVVGNRLFLRAANGRYFFWVDSSNDPDWTVQS